MSVFVRRLIGVLVLAAASAVMLPVLTSEHQSASTEVPRYELVEGQMGDWHVYVPRDYFVLDEPNPLNSENLYLRMRYPELTPIDSPTAKRMWLNKDWHNHIRVLAAFKKDNGISQHDLSEGAIGHLYAFDILGKEYGLVHRTQPDGYVKDLKDMWLEQDENSGRYASYTTCTEILTKASVPQCSHHFTYTAHSRLGRVTIDFDKRLLPQWKRIRDDVVTMFESFSSPDAARSFLYERERQINQPEKGPM